MAATSSCVRDGPERDASEHGSLESGHLEPRDKTEAAAKRNRIGDCPQMSRLLSDHLHPAVTMLWVSCTSHEGSTRSILPRNDAAPH